MVREQWSRLQVFLERDIWKIDREEMPRWRYLVLRLVQLGVLVIKDFIDDRCLLRASALTYATLLAIVPLLALMFALLKGFGVQNALEPLILEKLAAGSQQIVGEIISYINNTNVGRLGTVGLLSLLLVVWALLTNIEKSFNHIWRVSRPRHPFRRFADYFSVITIGPLFILVAISMTTTLESQAFVKRMLELAVVGELLVLLFKVIPFLVMWGAFTFLYLFMPNTRVSFSAALVGAVLGGTLWQLAQFGYVNFQVGVARYNAIYGTMAALPIFMVWIYLSWLIVLLGLEVSYAVQNLRLIRREILVEEIDYASREAVALTILLVIAEAFDRGEPPWDDQRIAERLELPLRLTRTILDDLVELGLLNEVRVAAGESAFQPGRNPQSLPLFEAIRCMRQSGTSFTAQNRAPEVEVVRQVEEVLREADQRVLEGQSLHSLVERLREKMKAGAEGGGVMSEE